MDFPLSDIQYGKQLQRISRANIPAGSECRYKTPDCSRLPTVQGKLPCISLLVKNFQARRIILFPIRFGKG
jgi:hypothetical protein